MNPTLTYAYSCKNEIKKLFKEYTDMLVDGDPKFKEYLEIQNYDDEILNFETKYGLPYGRLYVLLADNEVAGCIALRKIDDHNCEMKRLYVRPQFRSMGFGEMLVKQIIKDAKEIGYSFMLLDTLPFLKSALKMYKGLGFYEIPCYNNSPMDNSIYMKLDL